jgi:hypothetical protein
MRWFRAVLPRRIRASLGRVAEASIIEARQQIYDK